MRTALAAIILATAGGTLAATPAFAHRLDEYLQGTLISVGRNRLDAQMTLTPGVAVFPFLFSTIDTDGDGAISRAEQRAYAAQVLRDLWLTIDGRRLTPELVSIRFPSTDEMKDGRGEIQLDFKAELPDGGGRTRKITLENHHQTRISAWQVNCLVPRDPDIQIAAQVRNYSQSFYQLEYVDTGVAPDPPLFVLSSGWSGWLSALVLLLSMRMVLLWRHSEPRP